MSGVAGKILGEPCVTAVPGALMGAEIAEQPAVLAGLLANAEPLLEAATCGSQRRGHGSC